jgi:Rrf2 family nitric oxide-sensitive transcriptional repressor
MNIRKNTDYAIRTMMFLACLKPMELSNVAHISDVFSISQNHLRKIVNRLAQLGYLHSVRGKGGGIRLAKPAEQIKLGDLISDFEQVTELVDCQDGPCIFIGKCRLSAALKKSSIVFLSALNEYTLAQLISNDAQLKHIISTTIPMRESEESPIS